MRYAAWRRCDIENEAKDIVPIAKAIGGEGLPDVEDGEFTDLFENYDRQMKNLIIFEYSIGNNRHQSFNLILKISEDKIGYVAERQHWAFQV
ncbi:hypothetical protein AVEN_30190-1 [Araneus ventricosus]|uniref:Uncharacterized protein n=1 Tax=Araneus ventricosus TaxID=182803 RepID=A0A4Y2DPV0_ARAVE|nr:hypothetical protein AVEN_30190-1 [Araneus ventricosus]